ncbi:MAG: hypothetical protein JSV85_01530 [Candidatus Bathyarchaeota archaeon]|nr:MAG: hypothetical protein JSV85_01530 [Candidatus Bathyarchaeota archaeon]
MTLFIIFGLYGGVLFNLLVAYGLFEAKGWARMIGIFISALGLYFLAFGGLSLTLNFVTGGYLAGSLDPLTYVMDVSDAILSIAAIYALTRLVVKAYFEKKRILERGEELSREEHQKPTEVEYEKLSEEEKHLRDEYEQLMEKD